MLDFHKTLGLPGSYVLQNYIRHELDLQMYFCCRVLPGIHEKILIFFAGGLLIRTLCFQQTVQPEPPQEPVLRRAQAVSW